MTRKLFKYGRRSLLLAFGGFGAASLIYQQQNSQAQEPELNQYLSESTKKNKSDRGETLRQIATSKGIIYGGFTQRAYDELPHDIKFKENFCREYAMVVGGFFGVTVGPFGSNNYDFQQTDAFLNFAAQNNLIFRAHPLIWNEFNSPWLVEKFKAADTTSAEIDKIFTNHVATLAKRHAGRVHSWDVVNEAINVDDGRSDNLKDTTKSGIRGEKYPAWLNFLGPNYIERAFHIAAQADPKAILVYNDNGLTYSNAFGSSWDGKRRTAVLKLLERLKAKGTPVHALGIQSHLDGSRNSEFDGQKFRQFLSDVASMGLQIIISELDVSDAKLPKDMTTRDRLVAEAYYQYLSVVLDEPAVTTIVSWGLSDLYTWLSGFAPRKDGADVRPLLLDRQYLRKPAWNAVARALREAPSRIYVNS